jgi:hypothetical protein
MTRFAMCFGRPRFLWSERWRNTCTIRISSRTGWNIGKIWGPRMSRLQRGLVSRSYLTRCLDHYAKQLCSALASVSPAPAASKPAQSSSQPAASSSSTLAPPVSTASTSAPAPTAQRQVNRTIQDFLSSIEEEQKQQQQQGPGGMGGMGGNK